MMFDVSNKLALITGGYSGIGRALGIQLAGRGASLCLLARNEKMLQSAREEMLTHCISTGQKVTTIAADVTYAHQLDRKLAKWMEDDGVPDLVINSAGVIMPGEFVNLEMDIFHWMMDVNYFGTINVIKAVLPRMLERGSGYIVNIASSAALYSIYGYTAYSGSKFAVRGFTDALRSEMKLRNIHVSLVAPSDTSTPQLEFEKQHSPEITRILAETNGVMQPEAVAKSIIKGIEHTRYLILPGFETKFTFLLSGWLGEWTYAVIDWLVARAARKASRTQ